MECTISLRILYHQRLEVWPLTFRVKVNNWFGSIWPSVPVCVWVSKLFCLILISGMTVDRNPGQVGIVGHGQVAWIASWCHSDLLTEMWRHSDLLTVMWRHSDLLTHLTEYRQKLLYDARQLAKRMKLKAAWSQYGNIMVLKKDNGLKAISTYEDLRVASGMYPVEDSDYQDDVESMTLRNCQIILCCLAIIRD